MLKKFVETIRIIDAKLAIQDLSNKERNKLLKKRNLNIKELRKTYNANVFADVLDKKLSESEKKELEDQVIEILGKLNEEKDIYFHEFNEDTQEFEIKLDSNIRINAIVFAVMKLDRIINDVNTPQTQMLELMIEKESLLRWLTSKGAKGLADSLR